MNKKVSFDFDSTLDRIDVQEYCKELMNKGVEVYVVTSRYDNLHKSRYLPNPSNEDLFEVTDNLNIPRENIRFTIMRNKSEYLYQSGLIWHLDDDIIELDNMILDNCHTIGVHVEKENWKEKCNNLLNL